MDAPAGSPRRPQAQLLAGCGGHDPDGPCGTRFAGGDLGQGYRSAPPKPLILGQAVKGLERHFPFLAEMKFFDLLMQTFFSSFCRNMTQM